MIALLLFRFFVIGLLFFSSDVTLADESPRERIGHVLGQPVYRDQLAATAGDALSHELHNLFSHPVMLQYRATHKDKVLPTEREVRTAAAHFDGWHNERLQAQDHPLTDRLAVIERELKRQGVDATDKERLEEERSVIRAQLKPPGPRFAGWMVANWKLQRHLYENFGGGRVLWQQAGLEAFDAMHVWLKEREKEGDFNISDATLRDNFFGHWTSTDHGKFLNADPQFIDREFLNPYWLKPFIGESLRKNIEGDQS